MLRALRIERERNGLGPKTYRGPGCQIKEDLKTMGIKEDPKACWTTPFAHMIAAEILRL